MIETSSSLVISIPSKITNNSVSLIHNLLSDFKLLTTKTSFLLETIKALLCYCII